MVVAVASPSSAPPSTGRPHPTYKEMVVQALTELREPGGSSRRSIAKYIADRFSGLPARHDALLSVHLRRLRSRGLLLMSGNSYLLSTATASDAAPPPGLKRGPGRPRKNADLASSSAPFHGMKRGPGRPRSNAVPLPGVKRGPGRPPKNTTPVAPSGVKRGPGRPRRNATPMSLPTTAMPGGKRGRGRPPKNVPVLTVVAVAATPSGKRRPGRPPKSPKVVLPAHSSITAPAVPSLVAGTRKRGRPAKEKRPPSSPGKDKPMQPGSPDAALTKRGPGRPRKEKKLGVEHLTEAAGVDGQPGQAADQPGAVRNGGEASHLPSSGISLTKKRGRGRPRKRPLETETTATGVAALVEKRGPGRARKAARSGDVATMAYKRGRGRPRKGNPSAGSSVEAGSAASMGIKRGRGTPRKDTSFETASAEAAVGVSRHLAVGRPEKDEDMLSGKKTEIKGVLSEERMESRPADAGGVLVSGEKAAIAHVEAGGAVSGVDPIDSDMGTTSL